jgi:AcrR family transcriptional regulator
MRRHQNIDIGPVLHAAMTLVAAQGLKGLSLRPLAQQLETNVSALTNRFGPKDALVTRLVEAACEEDGAFLDTWLDRIRALEVRDGALMADIADAIFGDMAGPEALRTQFYCELLQGAVSRPEIAAALAPWQERRLDFWRAATATLEVPELAVTLHAASVTEGAHGLTLGALGPYRWIRRLALDRLCCGFKPAADASDFRQFTVFHAAMGDLFEARGRYQVPEMSELQARVARHVSAAILAEGADIITHREIAARVGLANSTLAYHFPLQEDLLTAGLNDIIARVHRVFDDLPPGIARPDFELTATEIARGAFALALAATRMPRLRPLVADIRRRRGENYLARLNDEWGGASPFDLLAAHALSIAGTGQRVLDGALEADPATGFTPEPLIRRSLS